MSSSSQVEMVWAMGFASLASNNFHLVVPMTIAQAIGDAGLNALKLRLGAYLHSQIIVYPEVQTQTLHLCRPIDYTGPGPLSTSSTEQDQPVSSPSESSSTVDSPSHLLDSSPSTKSKVPRPPNAFILYRKHFHPIVKAQNPDLRNNDISIMLGKQWNQESEEVKNEYRARAEKIKKKHAIDNPGYQYAPRKPSEKKRRMTSRKLAELRAVESQTSTIGEGSPSSTTTSAVATPELPELGFSDISQDFFNTFDDGQMVFDFPAPTGTFEQVFPAQEAPATEIPESFDDELRSAAINIAPTPDNTIQQGFLNSIIDWNGVQADADLVFGATDEETQALGDVETGNFNVDFFPGFNDVEFQQELDRLFKML